MINKKVGEIFTKLPLTESIKNINIKDINDDSRLIAPGDLFFIRERKKFDIFSVLEEIQAKAEVLVADIKNKDLLLAKLRPDKPLIFLDNIEDQFHQAIDKFYDLKGRNFVFIGVTGTNGKTTCTNLIYQCLKKRTQKVSLIGTISYHIKDKVFSAPNTTPDLLSINRLLKDINDDNHYVVMEASSHGISQERIKNLEFKYCVFTNLTRDHLDYHKTMEDYFLAKKKFFTDNSKALAIINIDDSYGRILAQEINSKLLTYGLSLDADLKAANIQLNKNNTIFDIIYKMENININTNLIGKHNIYNILAAVAVLRDIGIPLEEIKELMKDLNSPEGRLEKVSQDIYVDYAHTPDALEKILIALKEIGYSKIISVFGCGGDRDKGKRSMMGKIAWEHSFFSYITSDNPRNEKAEDICQEIISGFLGYNYAIIIDRKQAIAEAIRMKESYQDCCVLVAGKGHEDYQIIKGERFPFKDKEAILECSREDTRDRRRVKVLERQS